MLKLVKRGRYWHVRGTVAKTYICESTGTADRERAEAYRARRENQAWDRRFFGPGATVTLGEATDKYLEERQPGDGEKVLIIRILKHFGPDKLLSEINQDAADRMLASVLRPNPAPATKCRTLAPLEAIMNHGAKRGWCARPSFVKPQRPKGRLRWLTPTEALNLLDACTKRQRRLGPLLHFMLCTGARLSEALELEWDQIDLRAGTAVFLKTKNGKKRVAKLPSACIVTLANLPYRDGPVFRGLRDRPYKDQGRLQGGQIKHPFATVRTRAGLGPDVTPHVLRHSWASWAYALCKDPFLIKHEGGWEDGRMIEKYAHLMPARMVPEIAKVWGEHPAFRAKSDNFEIQRAATA